MHGTYYCEDLRLHRFSLSGLKTFCVRRSLIEFPFPTQNFMIYKVRLRSRSVKDKHKNFLDTIDRKSYSKITNQAEVEVPEWSIPSLHESYNSVIV